MSRCKILIICAIYIYILYSLYFHKYLYVFFFFIFLGGGGGGLFPWRGREIRKEIPRLNYKNPLQSFSSLSTFKVGLGQSDEKLNVFRDISKESSISLGICIWERAVSFLSIPNSNAHSSNVQEKSFLQ